VQKAKCGAYGRFCGTISHKRRAEDQPKVGLKKKYLPTTLDQTPSDYPGLVVVAVLIENMLE